MRTSSATRLLAILRMYQVVQPYNYLRRNTIKNMQKMADEYELAMQRIIEDAV